MIDVLQKLYDSEINFDISTLWDGGFDWQLGDEMNGYKASGNTSTLDAALDALIQATLEYYPDSVFARSYASS